MAVLFYTKHKNNRHYKPLLFSETYEISESKQWMVHMFHHLPSLVPLINGGKELGPCK
jgi:hypothetical protein